MRHITRWAGTLAVVGACLYPATAVAHETTTVADREVVIGWAKEPTFVGQPNAVEVTVRDTNRTGIEGLASSLKLTISFGESTSEPLNLEPAFNKPGTYEAAIVPTQPGVYTFHLVGRIDGIEVDISKSSSDASFDEVRNPTAVQFPTQQPSLTEVGSGLQRLGVRVSNASRQAEMAARAGLVVAVVALAVALLALAVGLRRR